jgi:hypothetical protein
VEELEAKVANLESRLVEQAPSAAPVADDSRVTELEAENASLRTQLAEEASHRQVLQTRLDDLELQMKTLSSFLQASTASSVSAPSPVTAFQAISPSAFSGSSSSAAAFPGTMLGPHSLVARESSLQRMGTRMAAARPARRPSTCKPTSSTRGTRPSGPMPSTRPSSKPSPLRLSISPRIWTQATSAQPKTRFFLMVSSLDGKPPKRR